MRTASHFLNVFLVEVATMLFSVSIVFVWQLLCSRAVSLFSKNGHCLLLCLNLSGPCANRFNTRVVRESHEYVVASRQIATRRLSSLLASVKVTMSRHFHCGNSIGFDLQPAWHVLLRQDGHAHTEHRDYRVGVPRCQFQNKSFVVCTAGFKVHPDAKMS